MSAAQPPARGHSRRQAWAPFVGELTGTASQATWGVWALCVLLLAAFAVVLGGALIGLFF